jgi:hypothetical protein
MKDICKGIYRSRRTVDERDARVPAPPGAPPALDNPGDALRTGGKGAAGDSPATKGTGLEARRGVPTDQD